MCGSRSYRGLGWAISSGRSVASGPSITLPQRVTALAQTHSSWVSPAELLHLTRTARSFHAVAQAPLTGWW